MSLCTETAHVWFGYSTIPEGELCNCGLELYHKTAPLEVLEKRISRLERIAKLASKGVISKETEEL